MSLLESVNWEKTEGLIPAIIQNSSSHQVLMLGYMNKEALTATLATEQVTFWSRSKRRLWTKGESSGNTLKLVSIRLDCDQDTLLIMAEPLGPTCHLGTVTCFDNDGAEDRDNISPSAFLDRLETVLASRKAANPEASYTASLYAKGTKRIAQKVGEEGVEVALAAVAGDRDEVINESADLLYHLLVLLQDQGLSLQDISARLKKRNR